MTRERASNRRSRTRRSGLSGHGIRVARRPGIGHASPRGAVSCYPAPLGSGPRKGGEPRPGGLRSDGDADVRRFDRLDPPPVLERRTDLALGDPTRPPPTGFLLAETKHEVVPANPYRSRKAGHEPCPVLVVEDMEEATVEDSVELLTQNLELRASPTTKRGDTPRSAAFFSAKRIAVDATSIPTASHPASAAISACSPVPQPTSSTRPRNRPSAASNANAGCGAPMSHGGVDEYAASNSATRSRLAGSSRIQAVYTRRARTVDGKLPNGHPPGDM